MNKLFIRENVASYIIAKTSSDGKYPHPTTHYQPLTIKAFMQRSYFATNVASQVTLELSFDSVATYTKLLFTSPIRMAVASTEMSEVRFERVISRS